MYRMGSALWAGLALATCAGDRSMLWAGYYSGRLPSRYPQEKR